MQYLREHYVRLAERTYLKNYNSFLFHRIKYYLDDSSPTQDQLILHLNEFLDPNFSRKDFNEIIQRIKMFSGTFYVLVPTKDRLEKVTSCIESVIGSSFRDFLIILIDNGLDGSYKVLSDRFGENVVGVPLNQKTGCAFLARNIGIDLLDLAVMQKKELKKQYVVYLDSDDVLCSKEVLSNFNKMILENDYPAMVNGYCEYKYSYEDRTYKTGTYPEYFTDGLPKVEDLCTFFEKGPNILSSAVRLDYATKVRYPEEFSFEDNGMNHKLIYRINLNRDCICSAKFPAVYKEWGYGSIASENNLTGDVTLRASLGGIIVKGNRAKIVKYLSFMSAFFKDVGL